VIKKQIQPDIKNELQTRVVVTLNTTILVCVSH